MDTQTKKSLIGLFLGIFIFTFYFVTQSDFSMEIPKKKPNQITPPWEESIDKNSKSKPVAKVSAAIPKMKVHLAKKPKEVSMESVKSSIDAYLLEIDLKDFDPILIKTIIQLESGFKPGAQSHENAIGLMGIVAVNKNGKKVWLNVLKENGIIEKEEDLFYPDHNIKAGVFILDCFRKDHNTLEKVLIHYTGCSALGKKYLDVFRYNQMMEEIKRNETLKKGVEK